MDKQHYTKFTDFKLTFKEELKGYLSKENYLWEQNTFKNDGTKLHVNNLSKYQWIKCNNSETEWQNRSEN